LPCVPCPFIEKPERAKKPIPGLQNAFAPFSPSASPRVSADNALDGLFKWKREKTLLVPLKN
jgi:hypothetical protein